MASALTREFVAVAGRLKGAGYITVADIVNEPWADFSSEASTAIAPPLQRFFVWSAARFQFCGDREVWHSQRGKMPTWFLNEMRFGDYLAACDGAAFGVSENHVCRPVRVGAGSCGRVLGRRAGCLRRMRASAAYAINEAG